MMFCSYRTASIGIQDKIPPGQNPPCCWKKYRNSLNNRLVTALCLSAYHELRGSDGLSCLPSNSS